MPLAQSQGTLSNLRGILFPLSEKSKTDRGCSVFMTILTQSAERAVSWLFYAHMTSLARGEGPQTSENVSVPCLDRRTDDGKDTLWTRTEPRWSPASYQPLLHQRRYAVQSDSHPFQLSST
jgi:hypothetical protein